MLDKSILNGVYDIHLHPSPSVATRLLDTVEMLKAAQEAGYAGFLVKDHYLPTAGATTIAENDFGDGTCKVFSSICLNNSVGGLNELALDVAYNMGTRLVYMPTVSAWYNLEIHKKKKFMGGGNVTLDLEKPIYLLDESGKLTSECMQILKYIASKNDLTLATGHISWQEVDVLVPAALEMGIKNVVVTHPHFDTNAPLEAVAKWGKMGAWIEKTACEFGQVIWDDDTRFNSIYLWRDYLDAGVPLEQLYVTSDFGQTISPHPIDGMFKYLNLLHDWMGFDEATLAMLSKTNPGKIMNQIPR